MRLLIRCPKCLRQYDVTGRPIGTPFRCQCGGNIMIEAPQGHDATVVRCSSCGAPRSEGANSCSYCHSDFTLHDRDLDSVCPACFARVSGTAKFCHHCGTALLTESSSTNTSPLHCPVCLNHQQLESRPLGDVNSLQCETCGGQWLTVEAFGVVATKAETAVSGSTPLVFPVRARPAEQDLPTRRTSRYRPCPICYDLMVPKNFGQRSGVIIDWCREHGVWFDEDELSRIVEWIRSGAWAKLKKEKALEIAKAKETARREHIGGSTTVFSENRDNNDTLDSAGAILEAYIGLIDLFL